MAKNHFDHTRPNIKIRKDNKTGYRGISQLPNGTYRAQISFGKRFINLGHFKRLADAVYARKAAERKYFTTGDPLPF